MKKKIDTFKQRINTNILKCPICHNNIKLIENTIRCTNNHNYDIAKKGYVNLLNKRAEHFYDKEMFEDRNVLSNVGFFDNLINCIEQTIKDNYIIDEDTILLDLGCGAGMITNKIKNALKLNTYGVDISKDAINKAASDFEDIIWMVGDISKLPFKENSVDIMINILSPINYNQVKKILKREGILIKVIPNSEYLKEIREYCGLNEYSNEEVFNLLDKNMNIIDTKDIIYKFNILQNDIKYLINMTPLTNKLNKNIINELLNMKNIDITCNFKLIVSKLK